MSNYSYSNTSDFVNATVIKPSEVYETILASSITSATILYGNVVGDAVTFYFDAALSGADVTTLNGIIAAYVNSADGQVLTTDSIDLVSNKNLFTDSDFFVDPTDNTKRLGFSASAGAVGSTLILSSVVSADRTITFPDISDIVVTLAATQSLTNKTLANVGISGAGNITASAATLYVQPSTTALTNTDYYFGYFGQPTTTGSSTGSAYTLYIAGAPTGTITNPYAAYVASGKTYIGGSLQIPTGASTNYVLASDSTGNASWVSITTIPKPFNDGNASTPSITFINEATTGLYRAGAGQLGITLSGAGSVLFKPTGVDLITGSILNVGTAGTSSSLNVYGVLTTANGLSVVAGLTTIQALTTAGLITANAGLTVANGGTLNVGTSGSTSPLNVYGAVTIANGLAVTSGVTTLQDLVVDNLITANAGLIVTNGQSLSIGSTGTTSPLMVYGLITGYYGLTVSVGSTSIQDLTAAGLITAGLGLTVATGQSLNVGTTGSTSPLNVYGLITGSNGITISGATALFTGTGFTSSNTATLTVTPVSTAVSGAANYYFTALTIPATTGSTTGAAYTFYIEGAPTGSITAPYSLYVATGKTYIGGALQIPNGAGNGYVLSSDASGNATWASLAAFTTFADGTAAAPSITFTSDTNTGLYVIGPDNMGITVGGTKTVDFSSGATLVTTDFVTAAGYRRNTSVNAGTAVALSSSDNFVEFSSNSAVIVTLPTIVGNTGREYTIVQTGSGNITINTASGSEFIDNGVLTSVSLTSIYSKITLVCGSTQWYSL
jgi:hypothetical protein